MADRKYYVICGDNCKFEGMTKEQILTAIEQAVNGGGITNIDAGFITTLKELNRGVGLRFWVGTSAEYNALAKKPENCFCVLTDEPTFTDVCKAYGEMRVELDAFTQQLTDIAERTDEMYTTRMQTDDGEHFYRVYNGKKEWFNPPCAVGTEYRTVERWNGKPVYTRIIEGLTSLAGLYVFTSEMPDGVRLIRQAGTCVYQKKDAIGVEQIYTKTLPYIDLIVDGGNGHISGTATIDVDAETVTAHAQIWYTYG